MFPVKVLKSKSVLIHKQVSVLIFNLLFHEGSVSTDVGYLVVMCDYP